MSTAPFNFAAWRAEQAAEHVARVASFAEALRSGMALVEGNGTAWTEHYVYGPRHRDRNSRGIEGTAEHVAARVGMWGATTIRPAASIASAWRRSALAPVRAEHGMAYGLAETRRRILAAGFTHVTTMGGPVPVREWRPFGAWGVNGASAIHFYLQLDRPEPAVIDAPWEPSTVFMVWPLVRS